MDALPGVGWANRAKLAQAGVQTVADVLVRWPECCSRRVAGGRLLSHASGHACLPLPAPPPLPNAVAPCPNTLTSPQARSKEFLQDQLGPKLGAQLWDYAHGRDERCAQPPAWPGPAVLRDASASVLAMQGQRPEAPPPPACLPRAVR